MQISNRHFTLVASCVRSDTHCVLLQFVVFEKSVPSSVTSCEENVLEIMLRLACVIVVSILISEAYKFDAGPNSEQWKAFQEFIEWKQEKQQQREYDANEYTTHVRTIRFDCDRNARKNHNQGALDPPPIDQAALMARYVVNQAGKLSIITRT